MEGPYKKLIVWQKAAEDLGYISEIPEGLDSLAAEVGRMLGAMLKKYGTVRCSP